MLVSLWRSVAKAGQPLPVEAMRALALLHSYLLLRPLTALGEHEVSPFCNHTWGLHCWHFRPMCHSMLICKHP